MKAEDGAYYAVKGFLYQFDYTILKILNSQNENTPIKIEQEQDLSYENYVVQVKYYETIYKKSAQKQLIKEATIKLLEEFKTNPKKKYCLYAYFAGEIEKQNTYSISEFNGLLGRKESARFDDALKQAFIKIFKVDFSKDFESQFENVIKKIQEIFSIDKKEACIHHASMSYFLQRIVVNNPKKKIDKRIARLCEIKKMISENRNVVSLAAYKQYLGGQQYLNLLKGKFECSPKHNNYLLLGENIKDSHTTDIADLIDAIVDKYYHNVRPKVKGKVKPFTIILQKSEDEIKAIKIQLIKNELWFNDGFENYCLSEKYFNEPPVLDIDCKSKTSKINTSSFFLRLLSYDNFKKLKKPIEAGKLFIFANNIDPDTLFANKKPLYFMVNDLEIDNIKQLFKKK